MIRVVTDLFEIVVLSRNANTLLRVRRARVGARSFAQEDIFKLIHPGVREEQRSYRRAESPKRSARSRAPAPGNIRENSDGFQRKSIISDD